MKQSRLLLQAFAVTVMGFVAHLTAPAPAASAVPSTECGWDRCTGVCGVGNPCAEQCGWVCMMPPNEPCAPFLTLWYEACPVPT